MKRFHNVTWVGDTWECSCGYRDSNDKAAYDHYINSLLVTEFSEVPQ